MHTIAHCCRYGITLINHHIMPVCVCVTIEASSYMAKFLKHEYYSLFFPFSYKGNCRGQASCRPTWPTTPFRFDISIRTAKKLVAYITYYAIKKLVVLPPIVHYFLNLKLNFSMLMLHLYKRPLLFFWSSSAGNVVIFLGSSPFAILEKNIISHICSGKNFLIFLRELKCLQ